MTFEIKRASREDVLAKDPLRDFFVWWDDISFQDISEFSKKLESAKGERGLQDYLQENPILLIQFLGGGHGRWVIPQKKLGSEFVTDFVIGHRNSIGTEWLAVELESPTKPMFTKIGKPNAQLNHAIDQIRDWRIWLNDNRDYALRPRSANGLGLTDIDSQVKGLIIMGRRSHTSNNPQIRRQIYKESNIEIHTYDWLLEQGLHRAEAVAKMNKSNPAMKEGMHMLASFPGIDANVFLEGLDNEK